MIAPLYKLGAFGDMGMVVVAILVGIGFGFFLERAGFGNSKKIANMFYFKDFRVFKMMFTIVITAMVLTYSAYYLGLLDFTLVQLAMSYVVPVAIGGALLGAGMVLGGYCPGTSIVAVVTRKKDAMFFLLGFLIGVVIYAEAYPQFESFTKITNLGQVTLSDITGLSPGLLVFLSVLLAIGSFIGLDKLIGKFYKSTGKEGEQND